MNKIIALISFLSLNIRWAFNSEEIIPNVHVFAGSQCGAQYFCSEISIEYSKEHRLQDSGSWILYLTSKTDSATTIKVSGYFVVPTYELHIPGHLYSLRFTQNDQFMYICEFIAQTNGPMGKTSVSADCTKNFRFHGSEKKKILNDGWWKPNLEKECFMFCFRKLLNDGTTFSCFLSGKFGMSQRDVEDDLLVFYHEYPIKSVKTAKIETFSSIHHAFENYKNVQKISVTFTLNAGMKPKLNQMDHVFVKKGDLSCEQKLESSINDLPGTRNEYFDIPSDSDLTMTIESDKIVIKNINYRNITVFTPFEHTINAHLNRILIAGDHGTDSLEISDAGEERIELRIKSKSDSKVFFYVREKMDYSCFHSIWMYNVDLHAKSIDIVTSGHLQYINTFCERNEIWLQLETKITSSRDLLKELKFTANVEHAIPKPVFYTCTGKYLSKIQELDKLNYCYKFKFELESSNLFHLDKCRHIGVHLTFTGETLELIRIYQLECHLTEQNCSIRAVDDKIALEISTESEMQQFFQKEQERFERFSQIEADVNEMKNDDASVDPSEILPTTPGNADESMPKPYNFGLFEKKIAEIKENVTMKNISISFFSEVKKDFEITVKLSGKKETPEAAKDTKSSYQLDQRVHISGELLHDAKELTVAFYTPTSIQSNILLSGVVVVNKVESESSTVDCSKPESSTNADCEAKKDQFILLNFEVPRERVNEDIKCGWIRGSMKEFSTEGCVIDYNLSFPGSEVNVTCKCNHLTSFAVLYGAWDVEHSPMVKSLFSFCTYIPICISCIALIYLIYLKQKERKSMKNLEVIFLSLNYLLHYATFVISSMIPVSLPICKIFAYASSFWVVHIYFTILLYVHRVYKNLLKISMRKSWVMKKRGFIIPTLSSLVWLIVVVIFSWSEQTTKCFLSHNISDIFILPLFIFTFITTTFISIRSYTKLKKRIGTNFHKKSHNALKSLLMYLCVMFGFSWALQFLINIYWMFQILFDVVNGSQGIILSFDIIKSMSSRKRLNFAKRRGKRSNMAKILQKDPQETSYFFSRRSRTTSFTESDYNSSAND